MIATERFEKVQIESLGELRTWLETNWSRPEGVWLVRFKKSVPEKFVDRLEVIDELLCFGWVDGIARKLDEECTMQLISPRKQQAWSDSYKKRVRVLEKAGRMASPGLASVARAKENGMWDGYALIDALIMPNALKVAFKDNPFALKFFEESATSYRRNVLRWISSAKRPETRSRRIASTVASSTSRKKLPQM